MLQSVTQKFHTAKVQVTEKFKAVKDKLLGSSIIEQLTLEELNVQLQSAKSRSKTIQEDIDKQQIKVMGDANLLEEFLAKIKMVKISLNNNITALNQQLDGQKLAIKDEIALFEAYNNLCNSHIQALKIEIDIAQKALVLIKAEQGHSQLKMDDYSDKLEKAKNELNRIETEQSNKTKEAINIAPDADTRTLQEASQKLSQRVKAEQDKNSLTIQKEKNQKLLEAEAIKLIEHQEAQKQKENEIEEKKAKIANYEQKIESNNKQHAKLKKDYENIKQTIKDLESSLSFSSSDYYSHDDSLDSIQGLCDRVKNVIPLTKEPEVITDTTNQYRYNNAVIQEEEFKQPSPRTQKIAERDKAIRELLQYNYLQEAEETIKLSLSMLVGYNNTDKYYEYLKSSASQETGLIEGEKLEALKQDDTFKELCKLALRDSQKQLTEEAFSSMTEDPDDVFAKEYLLNMQKIANWSQYTSSSYTQNEQFKSHLA